MFDSLGCSDLPYLSDYDYVELFGDNDDDVSIFPQWYVDLIKQSIKINRQLNQHIEMHRNGGEWNV